MIANSPPSRIRRGEETEPGLLALSEHTRPRPPLQAGDFGEIPYKTHLKPLNEKTSEATTRQTIKTGTERIAPTGPPS